MNRFRIRPTLTLGPSIGLLVVGVLLLNSSGFSQTRPPAARDAQDSALPAIDRGVMIGENRSPGGSPVRAARTVDRASGTINRTGAGGSRYLAGRVLVKFRGTMTEAVRTRAVQQVSRTGRLAARPDHADFDEVEIDPDEDAEAVVRSFAGRADVEYAQVAYRVEPRFVPNDTYYSQLQWNFPQVDLERAWDIQAGATSSIIVAVLDTGVAFKTAVVRFRGLAFTSNGVSYPALGFVDIPFARAPDLAASGTAGDSRFVAPHDYIWNDAEPFDLDGHGTHVSGTIGQLTNNSSGVAGIAFNARIMPVKVLSTDWDDIFGSPNFGTDETVAQGIRYAADNGAKVINMSIGRTGPAAPTVESALRYAVGKGCFVAIAGGNGFFDGNQVETYAEIASRVEGVVAVGAVNRAGGRAPYSTTGSWLELSAPGGDVGASTGYVYQQTYDYTQTDTFLLPPASYRAPRFDAMAIIGYAGTSMATPHVAGLAALLMQQGVTKPEALEAALEKFATDLGSTGRDNEFGYGEINARATLRGLGLAR